MHKYSDKNNCRRADNGRQCCDAFTCRVCGEKVSSQTWGTSQRNHCPRCLCSVHLDNKPGDRTASCGGIMEPIGVWVKKNGEWSIIHRCRECGKLGANRIAGDDNQMLLMSIAVRPLAAPPFPLTERDQPAVSGSDKVKYPGGNKYDQ